jgi:hypothetical protein
MQDITFDITLFLQIVITKNMVLGASRNVVIVRIKVNVTSTPENVHWDVIKDTIPPSANRVRFFIITYTEKCKVAASGSKYSLNCWKNRFRG